MIRRLPREYTVTGTVLPADLDDDGKVTSIGIESLDGEDYLIFMDRIGEEMMSLLDHKVEATGTVKDVYGDLIFTVSRYQVLEEMANRA